MNPRLVKFAVELQTSEKIENDEKNQMHINLEKKSFLNLFKSKLVTVPIEKQ